LLVHDYDLDEAVEDVLPWVAKRPLGTETRAALERAMALAAGGAPSVEKLATLGEGWVAEEALAIAVYAALAAPDFTSGVLLAVNHDGDSDSTGAIAGNLLGALHGIDQIPRKWLSELELGEIVAAIADDLATYPDWPVGEFLPESEASRYWIGRYPPN
jgi:ADP-ribosylglycohydrolase